MGQIVPALVEGYLGSLNRLQDPVLTEIARDGAAQDLPLVDAEVGALLRVLAVSIAATRILEVGTAIGYSGVWLAGALPPGGMLLTMEMDPERVRVARANFERAGLTERVNVIAGDAQRMIAKVSGPFDLIFQDGHKQLYVPLLDRLVSLLRPGGLLITDNVLWDGEVVPGFVAEPKNNADDTRAIADYNERLNTHPLLMTATIPLRGRRGDLGQEVRTMTVDAWLAAAIADAERRGLPELKVLLEGLAQATRALRAAGFDGHK